ncbi:cytochrome c oxidase subunit 3 [Roseiarcus sp.]|uniref:cytochrome c oxidase subunit 3 n=1 Tax=Roseiarcus sp. TaxID=1969460 RepID=UPI003F9D0FA8
MTDAPIAAHATIEDAAPIAERPGFHLVDPSPWPIVGSICALLTAVGLILTMKDLTFLGGKTGPLVLAVGIAGILFTMAGWWRDVIFEAQTGHHNALVRHGLTIGMILFIASEVMFFVAWFWAFFASSLGASDAQVYGRLDFTGGLWPPKGTEVIDPLRLPLMNTFVLVASSFAVNVAHDEFREGNREGFKGFLMVAIALGVLFVGGQAYEYIHAPFAFRNSIYGATFFMATGFHGAHVIIGVIFLTVCLMRAFAGQFTPRHHLGFQFAAWYWHFVDVVWLFLFSCIYLWGSWGATIEAATG